MRDNFKKLRKEGKKLVVMLILVLGIQNPISVLANEHEAAGNEATTRAGTENLPVGSYEIGSFTFTDTNLTPVKTVLGSNVSFGIAFRKASTDTGIGGVKLTVQIRDTNGNALSPKWVYTPSDDSVLTFVTTPTINLGYRGRPIRIWFDASSTGQSNGNFRSIEVASFISYVG